jgi:hypothetical protein
LRGRLGRIQAAGAELVFIGNGTPAQAGNFQSRYAPGIAVYTDPGRETYQALGMRRSVKGTLGPSSLVAGLQAWRQGFSQTGTEGDPFQLGGLIAVARGGEVRYAQLFQGAGDRPDLEAALAALVSPTPPPAA